MIFEHYSQVHDLDIKVAGNEILDATDDNDPSKQMEILRDNPLWKKALEKQEEFQTYLRECEREKNEALNAIDTTDLEATARYSSQFQVNDATIWNPYYRMTEKILKSMAPRRTRL